MIVLWRVKHLETRRVVADYSSAGQGRPTVTQLVADGEVIANAIEQTTWTDSRVQPIVCTGCGIEHCAPGGWVALRTVGPSVLWLPAFSEMRESDFDAREYRPPDYMSTRGIPTFDAAHAAMLVASMPSVPRVEQLLPLRSDELVLAMQWTAPGEILGTFPGPAVVRETDVLAVSTGDRDEYLRDLAALLRGARATSEPVVLRPWSEADERIEFYLDTPGHPVWSPLARVGGVLRLHFEGIGVDADDGSGTR